MTHRTLSRRQVIRDTAMGAAGLAVAGLGRPALGALGANDRIRVGIIGPGDRGLGLLHKFFARKSAFNAELVAICDLWKLRREEIQAEVKTEFGVQVKVYRNTEELYGARVVDAVIIATPDFSHAILTAEAVRAGMDVYAEKPLAHNLEDAKLVRQAVQETGKILQVGTGMRSRPRCIGAARLVKEGRFGKITNVELCCNVNDPMRWRRPERVQLLKEEDTDWERYQLNRPRRPFDARRYLEFRLFWPYSSGLPDQWMSHFIDAVAMISGDLYPKSCVASGGIYQWHDGRENPDTFAAILEYPSGFQVRYTSRQNNSYEKERMLFLCNQGTLDVSAGKVLPEGGIGKEAGGVGDLLEAADLAGGEEGTSHMANWLECLRTRRPPNADITAGYSHSIAVAMAIMALQTGRKVIFNPDTHELRQA